MARRSRTHLAAATLATVVASVFATGILAPAGRAEDAAAPAAPVPRQVLTNAELRDFLREAGYTPSPNGLGWAIASAQRLDPKYATEQKLYANVAIAQDPDQDPERNLAYIVIASPPAPIPADEPVPHDRLKEMLGFNEGESGIAFCIARSEKRDAIHLMRFLDNRALIPSKLGLEIEEFFDQVRTTRWVWNHAEWKSRPAVPGAAMGEGRKDAPVGGEPSVPPTPEGMK
jgi:hypothetical protein